MEQYRSVEEGHGAMIFPKPGLRERISYQTNQTPPPKKNSESIEK